MEVCFTKTTYFSINGGGGGGGGGTNKYLHLKRVASERVGLFERGLNRENTVQTDPRKRSDMSPFSKTSGKQLKTDQLSQLSSLEKHWSSNE